MTDGMKLDPAQPDAVAGPRCDPRGGRAGGGTAADRHDIWAGFAARGMGASAQILNAATGQVVQAFDMPGLSGAGATLVAESIPNGRLDPYETVSMALCVTNAGVATSGSVAGTLLATGGVRSPSGPQSYGAMAPGATVCRTYTLTVAAACGATLTATLQTQETGGATRNLTYPFQVSVASSFSQDFDAVTPPVLPSGWTTSTLSGGANPWVISPGASDSPFNHAFVADPAGITDNALVSPTIAVPPGASRLTFRHFFATESSFDGGVLEIAIGGGLFQDILAAGEASRPERIRAHSLTPSVAGRPGRGIRAPTLRPPSTCRQPRRDRTSSSAGA